MNQTSPTIDPPLRETMQNECIYMARHALASGLSIPPDVLRTLEEMQKPSSDDEPAVGIEHIGAAHQVLAQLVAPSTPRSISLLARERLNAGWLRFFGPIPLVRWLMITAIIFLVLLVALASSSETNLVDDQGAAIVWSIFNSSGTKLLIRLTFLMSAAGLGACFAALFLANRYIVNGTYDPKYSVSYWIRVVLGLIAGVILSEFIPLGVNDLAGAAKPILALLGGFSASTLYRILSRLIQSIESVIQGDISETVQTQQRSLEALSNQRLAEQQLAISRARLASDKSSDQPSDTQSDQDKTTRGSA